jgi:N,N'-diacetyllegionaminate synthase
MNVPWRSDRVFLIAEAGVNHNGDVGRALAMVDLAAEAGADAVKFQTFQAEALVTKDAAMADYQQRNLGTAGSQLPMLRALELSHENHLMLKRRAEELGIIFFSTAFDDASIDFLASLDQPLWKIPSGEITNYPYLVRVAGLNKPTILSTGMATLAEVGEAVGTLESQGLSLGALCILHCNTEYPTPWEDVNLRAMPAMGAALGCDFGYSDHTPGTVVSVAAAALGARVIEKHFTLDKELPGPDHKASLAPEELREWVSSIRAVGVAMGSSAKRPAPSERKNRAIVRKSVVASCEIRAGEIFSSENLAVKRAGAGLSPMQWPGILGRRAPRNFVPDEVIEL